MSERTTFFRDERFWLGFTTGLAAAGLLGYVAILGQGITMPHIGGKKDVAPAAAAPAKDPSAPKITLQPVTDKDWVRGSRDAKVSIVEFSDTECPFCKQFHKTLQNVVTQYDGKVNWVYRHSPIATLHSKAQKEAEALECAAAQGGNDVFWKYMDLMMERTPSNDGLDTAQLPKMAGELGLDVAAFTACLDSGTYAQKVEEHTQQADAAGGTGTPYAVIVAGEHQVPVKGAYPIQMLKSMIDPLLQ